MKDKKLCQIVNLKMYRKKQRKKNLKIKYSKALNKQ